MKYNSIKILSKVDTGTEPVSLEDAKRHLRITSTDEDDYLPALIIACRKEIEGICNVSLVDKTIVAELRHEVVGLELPYGPAVAISSLVDADGEDIEYDTDNLVFDHYFEKGLVEYDTVAETREDLNFKILELIAYKFTHRGDAEKPVNRGSWLV